MPNPVTDIAVRSFQILDLPDAEVFFCPTFFTAAEADRILGELRDTTAWQQQSFKMFGKPKDFPRLTAWYGNQGAVYVYSGIRNVPLPWTSALLDVKCAVEPPAGIIFNGVLLNRYRTGKDSVNWHSDDEPEFGHDPVIASASFGATRTFKLRHKKRKELKATVELMHGSLLIMRGGTQTNWVHQVPKTARPVGERLNLTFRAIVAPAR
jgi:alkylated DNA repair dioxygenase AlkB